MLLLALQKHASPLRCEKHGTQLMRTVDIQSECKSQVKVACSRLVDQASPNLFYGLLFLGLFMVAIAGVVTKEGSEFVVGKAMWPMRERPEVPSLPEGLGRDARIEPIPGEQAPGGLVHLDGSPAVLSGPSDHQADHRFADTFASELMAAQRAEGQIHYNHNAVILFWWAEKSPPRCTHSSGCAPGNPHKMSKDTTIVPRDGGAIAARVLLPSQEVLKLVAGDLRQPRAAVRFAPDDAGPRLERMCACALIDDPGVIHQLHGHNLAVHVNDHRVRHDFFSLSRLRTPSV